MAVLAVITAVESRLVAGFAEAPIIETNGGQEPPADGSEFVVVQYPVANNEQMTLGRYYREEGAFRVVISAQRGLRENLIKALGWADTIAALFRTQKFDGVESWTPNLARLDDDNDEGNYYVISVVVPYTFKYRG